MNLETIKKVISDAIPNNVRVSNIDIKEGDGTLSVQISWEVLKEKARAMARESLTASLLNNSSEANWSFLDGYCRPRIDFPIIDFNQQIPLSDLPLAYRDKIKVEFDQSIEEGKKIRDVFAETSKARGDAQKAKTLVFTAGAEDVLRNLAKKVAAAADNTKEVKLPDDTVARTISVPKSVIPKGERLVEVAVKGSEQYVKALIRSGLTPLVAQDMAQDKAQQPIKPIPIIPPKTTCEGKIITPVDLPIPKQEPTFVPRPNTREEISAIRKQKNPGFFRRVESDNQTTVIVDNKPKVVDGYAKTRFVKKAFEVVEEYKKAVEAYDKRYSKIRSPLAKKPKADDKGKRGVVALTPHTLPFSHPDRKVTDVEVMFLANERMAKLVEPPSLLEDLKNMEAKIPRPTKLKKILFHLKSIKDEILRKPNG